jgi:polysaccharide chain length determinant protein (PEP-CTERM system associated)
MAADTLELQYYIHIIQRRKWQFCFILFTIVGLSTFGSYCIPEEYAAATTILIQREPVSNPLVKETTNKNQVSEVQSQLRSYSQLIATRSSLLRVIAQLQLHPRGGTAADQENLVKTLQSGLEVVTGNKEDLFQIVYTGQMPPNAVRDIANTVTNVFMEQQRKLRGMRNLEGEKFTEGQLQVYKDLLGQSEEALKQFKQTNLGQTPETEKTNLDQLGTYQKAFAENELKLQEAGLKKAALEKQLAAEQAFNLTINAQGRAETPEERLLRLQAELAMLLTNYSEKYPEVIRVRNEIDWVKQQAAVAKTRGAELDTTNTSLINPEYQKLRKELRDINIQIDLLQAHLKLNQAQIEQYTAKTQSIPQNQLQLDQLTRNVKINESIYQMLKNRLEETRVGRELDASEKGDFLVVVDQATAPMMPVKPNRVKIMLFGFISGALCGLGMVYFLEFADPSLRDIRHVEAAVPLPMLGIIPHITTRREQWSAQFRSLCYAAAVILCTGLFITLLGFELLKKQKPTFTAREFLQYASLTASNLISKVQQSLYDSSANLNVTTDEKR